MEEDQTEDNGIKLKEILVTIVVAVSLISVTALTLSADWTTTFTGNWTELQHTNPGYTTSFTNITPQDVQVLINNSFNLVIVDAQGCDCDYNEGHIPNAIWRTSPTQFYNITSDLLIYCQDGLFSTTFCERLVGHTYSAIYYLEGGIDAWESAGYRTTTLS